MARASRREITRKNARATSKRSPHNIQELRGVFPIGPASKSQSSRSVGGEESISVCGFIYWLHGSLELNMPQVLRRCERLSTTERGGWKRALKYVRHAVKRTYFRRSIDVKVATAWFVRCAQHRRRKSKSSVHLAQVPRRKAGFRNGSSGNLERRSKNGFGESAR